MVTIPSHGKSWAYDLVLPTLDIIKHHVFDIAMRLLFAHASEMAPARDVLSNARSSNVYTGPNSSCFH